jgi:hypothetical protein
MIFKRVHPHGCNPLIPMRQCLRMLDRRIPGIQNTVGCPTALFTREDLVANHDALLALPMIKLWAHIACNSLNSVSNSSYICIKCDLFSRTPYDANLKGQVPGYIY